MLFLLFADVFDTFSYAMPPMLVAFHAATPLLLFAAMRHCCLMPLFACFLMLFAAFDAAFATRYLTLRHFTPLYFALSCHYA